MKKRNSKKNNTLFPKTLSKRERPRHTCVEQAFILSRPTRGRLSSAPREELGEGKSRKKKRSVARSQIDDHHRTNAVAIDSKNSRPLPTREESIFLLDPRFLRADRNVLFAWRRVACDEKHARRLSKALEESSFSFQADGSVSIIDCFQSNQHTKQQVFPPSCLPKMSALPVLDCRMYEAKFPEVDDVVMVMVREKERKFFPSCFCRFVSFFDLHLLTLFPFSLSFSLLPPLSTIARSTTSPRWVPTSPCWSTPAPRA